METLRMATKTDTSPELHSADSHEAIRVHGARVNNLKDVSVEIPKRRLTVFTGVSGSGKSSLVFGTIAAESQRLINETYSAFVQGFMPTLARPEVDVLEGLTTAILVDQERMGADVRSTVGTATDAGAMLRILFSRLGRPHIGSPQAFSFNVGSISGAGAVTIERAGRTTKEKRSFSILGGMCPRCEGRGSVNDIDLAQLYDEEKALSEGALTIPGYSMDGWYGRIFKGCGFFDPDKSIKKFTKKELNDLLYKEPTRIKVDGVNLTYEGLVPRIQKSMLAKDVDSLQPHVRAFVERAVTFTTCPECEGTRLSTEARSSKIAGINIADASAMQITDLAEWVRGLNEPSVAPLLQALGATLDSFVDIGLGYLSLDRPSGTLSGGEAQRVKMIRQLGSSLTDVTYVFDEPTIGLHPHDIQRMNELLLALRDKGNTVLVAAQQPGDIYRAARPDPQGVRQGQRRQAGAVQRQLRGRLSRLQRGRRDLHRPGDNGRRRHHVRGVRGQALPGRGAQVQVRRQGHQRGARDAGGRGHGVLRRRQGEDAGGAHDPRAARRRRARLSKSRPAAHHAVRRRAPAAQIGHAHG
jgi:excinuclease UvrABC ATPase subunit